MPVAWTSDELLRLVRAWRDSLSTSRNGGKAGKKKIVDETALNQAIYQRFMALRPFGATHRNAQAVAVRLGFLRESYAFIRNFQDDTEASTGVEWFSLPKKNQRTLMKTAGAKPVQPIDEEMFLALHEVLQEEFTAAGESDESGSEIESLEVTESDGSEGDKYQWSISHRKKTTVKKPRSPRRSTRLSDEKRSNSDKSSLEEETGELIGREEDERDEDEPAQPKRRHLAAANKAIDVQGVLDRRSLVLAGFLEKRVEERTKEYERSRQEREADQKFWAAETAKDRALLCELLKDK